MSKPSGGFNPRDRETAAEVAKGRLEAGQQLFYLFGGTTAEGKEYDGILHQRQISALEANLAWKNYLDGVRKDPHAKTLAVISASRNDPKFPPALVALLFSNEEQEDSSRWFAEVFLAGAAQIHAATGKGLILPPSHASLDLVRSAFNLVDHLDENERKTLGLAMPDETPKRNLATTLAGILAEATAVADEPGLTAAQRFYHWAVRKWEDREYAVEERRRQRAVGDGKERGGGDDATNLLPPAPGKSPVPAPPQAAATPALPPTPVPTAKPNGSAAEMPAPPAPLAPVAVAPAAPPAKDAEQELVFEALASSGPAGKAMVALVRKGQRSFEQATAFAAEKGLF